MRVAGKGPIQTRPYWVLLSRNSEEEPWAAVFGDYVRRVVADVLREHVGRGYMVKNLKMLQVSVDLQAEIERRVKDLNQWR